MNGGNGMYNSGSPNRRLFVCKHFMRFIRPGYVQVQCTEGDADVAAIAFKNGTDFTIVALNMSKTTNKTVNFNSFTGAPSYYHMYRSSANENCVYLGKFTNNSFQLLPESVATLYFKSSEPDVIYAPTAPTGLTITATTDNSIKVSWTAATAYTLAGSSVAVSGYTVYVDGVKKTTSGPITATTYTVTGLKAGTTHTIAIYTRDALYNESAPVTISGTTTNGGVVVPPPPPGAIEDISSLLSVYPNPASGMITVDMPADDVLSEISVIDITGTVKIKLNVVSAAEKIDISSLAKGVYVVIAKGTKQTYKTKLLIE